MKSVISRYTTYAIGEAESQLVRAIASEPRGPPVRDPVARQTFTSRPSCRKWLPDSIKCCGRQQGIGNKHTKLDSEKMGYLTLTPMT